ncbi:MAG: phospho-sugar mutase [Clostridia bacterium]|nr:phospho-sugar mutase [Clostridia bacterium]
MEIQQAYTQWLSMATEDADLIPELKSIEGKEDEIFDRFYRELEFGTAGLRGVIGAGTNRMNIYTVRKATQGLAEYILSEGGNSAAIAYDSRIKSDLFAKEAARVLAANGITVYIYKELMPTPMLSYAVRELNCTAGIVVTASHNPSKYNGYKAYGSDGCQLSVENSEKVLDFVDQVAMFGGAKLTDFDKALAEGTIQYISDDLIENYLNAVASYAIEPVTTDLKVIYTPLNGTGNKPVRAILDKIGVKNVTVVKEQELPDGNFPTAPYPNPEIRQAFECALKLAETVPADLLLATDPDADRVGIAVADGDGYTLMSGNEVGALLLDYILSRRTANGTLPQNPVAVKTIVSTQLAAKIAAKYNCQLIDVLTGFKYIGEQVGLLEAKGEENRFVFGFEESYGYNMSQCVRDKDAVIASMLICEMAAYYKGVGKSLLTVLADLYKEHGIFCCSQNSFTFEGAAGMEKMKNIMASLRENPPKKVAEENVTAILDYGTRIETDTATGKQTPITLPKSEVLYYRLGDDGDNIIVRPSGTEPKIKIYITAIADTEEKAKAKSDGWLNEFKEKFN